MKQPDKSSKPAGPVPESPKPTEVDETADETGNRALHRVASGPNPHVERHGPPSEADEDKSPAGRW